MTTLNHNILKKISDKGLSEAIQNEFDQVYAYIIFCSRDPVRGYGEKNLKFLKTNNLKELYSAIFMNNIDIFAWHFLYVWRQNPVVCPYIDSSLTEYAFTHENSQIVNDVLYAFHRHYHDKYDYSNLYEQFTKNLSSLEDKICEYISQLIKNGMQCPYYIIIEKMTP